MHGLSVESDQIFVPSRNLVFNRSKDGYIISVFASDTPTYLKPTMSMKFSEGAMYDPRFKDLMEGYDKRVENELKNNLEKANPHDIELSLEFVDMLVSYHTAQQALISSVKEILN